MGNSITYSGQYVAYIDAYLTLKYPGKQYECINLGLPSETVSGLSEPGHGGGRFPRPDLRERLERVLTQTQPNLVIACYGMNDGIYMPFDDERFKAFREGIGWLHEQVTKAEVSLLYATPPVYDERKGKAYANVLDIYSDWLISLRYTQNRRVVDIHWPMKKYQEDRRQADSLFAYAADGIHPNETGHFVMAKQILLSLGESELTGAKTIQEALAPYAHADMVLKLVEKRQAILKDAWLTHTGHKRPGMSKGLPLQEATEQAAAIDRQIRALVRKPKAM